MLFKTAKAKIKQLASNTESSLYGSLSARLHEGKIASRMERIALDPKNNFYLDVWAVSSFERFGFNENADGFEHEELTRSHPTFIGSWACLDHQNWHENLAVGSNVDSVYTPDQYVRIVMGVNRHKSELRHPGLEQKIADGHITDTSMGATLPGTPVTMADGTQKPIEEIKVGDLVITHNGTIEPVAKIHTGKLKTKVYRFKVAGVQYRLPLTEEHPVWTMKKYMVRSELGCGQFTEARNVEVGDYVLTPTFHGQLVGVNRSPAFVKILGWYLAEGNRLHGDDNDGVMISLGAHEEYLIPYAIELFKSIGYIAHYYRHSNGKDWRIEVNSKDLCKEFNDLVGHGARTKILSDEIMKWPKELQSILLGHYIDGDGCFDGELHLSTSSKQLAVQLTSICARLGMMPVRRENLRHPGKSGFTDRDRIEYQIDIGKLGANILAPFARKIQSQKIHKFGSGALRVIRPDGIYAPVRSIEIEDYEGECWDLDVGFSVKDGSHSYVANDIAVHNCWARESVCGIPRCANVATEESQFCDHVANMRGQKICTAETNWLPMVCGELNRGVIFFEDSIITDSEGADRNAKILHKIASDMTGHRSIPSDKLWFAIKKISKTASSEEKIILAQLLEALGREL